MTNETRVAGGCMCGRVRYEADGPPLCVGHCHCESCRRHTGAPIVTFVVFEAAKARFTHGDRRVYNSSPGVRRGFCEYCGTPLTWEGQYRGYAVIEFHISTLDDPDTYAPDRHWHFAERISWFDVQDDLPRYRSTSAGTEPYCHGPASKSR
ncbi:MAG: GFA family protein [Gammaproteobacteria bacterium]|nr:GFA family protein [Gammaproteobacteria bacterium]NIR82535.1 GFA family protein [Gammaproteobacteria bacterium]NIR88361.1 GFA family protein [Gammaproteobacteria bacterium]NIU03673.1 GFA family protein [Gammaproteobacteria bacterium]NIV52887.1 GFA family protein [Gammaproteobacteria bacterium]